MWLVGADVILFLETRKLNWRRWSGDADRGFCSWVLVMRFSHCFPDVTDHEQPLSDTQERG
jgi:hypothetical protein